ncbi:MAG: hypothetical protein NVS2B7_37450 [Herpetosiphon sp.]
MPADPSIVFRALQRTLPHVSPSIGYPLCDMLARTAPFLPAWPVVLSNLGHVLPAAPTFQLHRSALQVFRNLFKNYYDLLRSASLTADDLVTMYHIEGLSNGRRALDEGRGVLVCTLHTGNFSLAFEPVARALQTEILLVVEQLSNPAVYNIVNMLRQRQDVTVLPSDRNIGRHVLRMLGRGGAVILAQDRLVNRQSVRVPFFGQFADLPRGPATLALHTGAPILPVWVSRQPDNSSRVVIDPPLVAVTRQGHPEAVQWMTAALARVLEAYIRADPSQWILTNSVWPLPDARACSDRSPAHDVSA